MKHTKGEWKVGEENDVYSGGACVAMVCGAPEGIEESIANAHLIAAAPEMYEALKYIIRALSEANIVKRDSVFMEYPNEVLRKAGGG